MRSTPTARIILDTRRKYKDNKYPLTLRVIYQRKAYYISLASCGPEIGINQQLTFSKSAYEAIFKGRRSHAQLRIYQYIQDQEQKAFEIITNLKPFMYQEFRKKYLSISDKSFIDLMKQKIKSSTIKTAGMYQMALNNITSRKGNITYESITPAFLNSLESEMIADGLSPNTISMYFRCYRAVFNEAIAQGEVAQSLYPFGRGKYVVPSRVGNKKALSKNEILLLWNYKPKDDNERMYKNYWFFSYLANGMNIKDMINLKYENIQGDYIRFIRSKTRSTKKQNVKPVQIYISPEIAAIIDYFSSIWGSERTYIFPDLEPGMPSEEQERKRYNLVKQINKYIGAMSKEVGITTKVTTYVARHSFATVLERAGVRRKAISDALSHSSFSTTEIYLDSLNTDELVEISQKLL